MNKFLKKLVFGDEISVSVLDTTEMVNDAIKIHNLTPLTAAALGRTLTAATFMAGDLKNESDKLSVVVAGDGVGGKITVCGDGKLKMRGAIDYPAASLPLKANGKLDVGGCVGTNGRITVIKSMGLKESYSGTSELISGEIAEDFTAYFAYSEQRPTAMALGVKIGKDLTCVGAGGVIIQSLPNASEESLIKSEEIIKGLKDVSSQIESLGAEGLMEKLFGAGYEEYQPEYKCNCSRSRAEGIVVSLGKTEAFDIIEKEGAIKINCEFCNSEYSFTKEDAEKLFND